MNKWTHERMNEGSNGIMKMPANERTTEWTNERTDERMNKRTFERMNKRTNNRIKTNEWTHEYMNNWANERMNEWPNEKISNQRVLFFWRARCPPVSLRLLMTTRRKRRPTSFLHPPGECPRIFPEWLLQQQRRLQRLGWHHKHPSGESRPWALERNLRCTIPFAIVNVTGSLCSFGLITIDDEVELLAFVTLAVFRYMNLKAMKCRPNVM